MAINYWIKVNVGKILVAGLFAVLALVGYVTVKPFFASELQAKSFSSVAKGITKSFVTSVAYMNWQPSGKKNPKDQMPLSLIPAGHFSMGADDVGNTPNSPSHLVNLDSYYIYTFEVTNWMYSQCVRDKKCDDPAKVNPYFGNVLFSTYPVVYITWKQAADYCAWSGGDLPTEAEWEMAARGPNNYRWPWGNAAPDSQKANYGNSVALLVSSFTYPDGASPFEVANMAGNAREWVKDRYNPTYYKRSPAKNPQGSPSGDRRSLRGGSYLDDQNQISSYNRFSHDPDSPGINRGFRCVIRPQLRTNLPPNTPKP